MTSEETIKLRRRLAKLEGLATVMDVDEQGKMTPTLIGVPPLTDLNFLARVEAAVIGERGIVKHFHNVAGHYRLQYLPKPVLGEGEMQALVHSSADTFHEAWALAIVALADKIKEEGCSPATVNQVQS